MLLGCVQPAMMPNINSATARVLDAAGIQTLVADGAGCCGAIRTHLNDTTAAWPTCAATSTPGGRWSTA
jgi:glycolate oxidase iron-sulfur subunit